MALEEMTSKGSSQRGIYGETKEAPCRKSRFAETGRGWKPKLGTSVLVDLSGCLVCRNVARIETR